jgi:hypothetical protein
MQNIEKSILKKLSNLVIEELVNFINENKNLTNNEKL